MANHAGPWSVWVRLTSVLPAGDPSSPPAVPPPEESRQPRFKSWRDYYGESRCYHMPEMRIRKDTAEGIVEVNTGDGWRGLSPDAARDMADSYEAAITDGALEDRSGTRRFISLLREYADDLE